MRLKIILLVLFCASLSDAVIHGQEVVALIDKIVAADRAAGDSFGGDGLFDSNVSIFGNFAAVGASWEGANNEGAVYLFRRMNACTWVQVDKVFAQNTPGGAPITDPEAQFGTDVKLHGTTLAVSAERVTADGVLEAGSVYIYDISAGTAVLEQVITAQNESVIGGAPDSETDGTFGSSLDLRGNLLIVGARQTTTDEVGGAPIIGAGAAYIYRRTGGTFFFEDKIVASNRATNDEFGRSVSIDGDFAIVGAPWKNLEAGRAYIYQFELGDWDEVQELQPTDLVAEDLFGYSVTINDLYIGVGSPANHSDEFGILTGGLDGAVYMYELDGTTWIEEQKVVLPFALPSSRFGYDLQLWNERILIGSQFRSPDECGGFEVWSGSAYTYERNIDTEVWEFDHQFSAPDRNMLDLFGTSVGIFEDEIIIGAPSQDFNDDFSDADLPMLDAGAAYIYEYKILPDPPVIEADEMMVCEGAEVTLTITSGDLADGEYWEWYEGDCDSAPIGIGTSITVSPDVTTTYCARGKAYCGAALDDYCISVEGECACITIEVIDGFWHQSTKEGIYDQANDVITDSEGNVYITGEYIFNATFNGGGVGDEFISSSDGDLKSYVAKYDHCGTLRWVAYARDVEIEDYNKGTSITVDEANGLVYTTGYFTNVIEYHDGIGVDAGLPSSETSLGAGSQAYVACFDMNNGDVNYVNTVSMDPVTTLNAITINKNTGRIYVGGERALTAANTKAFIQRYSPTGAGIGAADWTVNGLLYHQEKVNDLDYAHEGPEDGSLWIIGNYKGKLRFTYGPVVLTSSYHDAYITRYKDDFVPAQAFLRKGSIVGEMTGNGIAVDEVAGVAYATGSYKGMSPGAYEFSTQPLPGTPDWHAYFIAIDGNGFPGWTGARFTQGPTPGVTRGYAAAVKDGRAYFTGTYSNSIIMFTGGGPLNHLNSGAVTPHTYAVAYSADASGTFSWRNATVDLPGFAARHIPSAIATDNFGNAFISGGYNLTMDYLLGLPTSGPLNTAAQLETFVMRVNLGASGALESAPIGGSDVLHSDANAIDHNASGTLMLENEALHPLSDFTLYPNPSDDVSYLNINNYDIDGSYRFEMINLQGKIVLDKMIERNVSAIDLSDLPNGIYVAQLIHGTRTQHVKFIKQ